MNNLPALKSSYQAASEIHRQIVESGSLILTTEEKIRNRLQAVEAARKTCEIVTGKRLVGAATDADQFAAQNKLDAAIADHNEATTELAALHSAIYRLKVSMIDVKADLENQTNAAISEIMVANKISIKENEKLRQMLLEIHSAYVLASHVQVAGAAGFANKDVFYSPWSDLLTNIFREASPDPSHDELEAALAAFKEKYGFHDLWK